MARPASRPVRNKSPQGPGRWRGRVRGSRCLHESIPQPNGPFPLVHRNKKSLRKPCLERRSAIRKFSDCRASRATSALRSEAYVVRWHSKRPFIANNGHSAPEPPIHRDPIGAQLIGKPRSGWAFLSLAIDSALDGYSLNTNKQTQETVPPSRLAPLRTGPFSCASVAPCLKSRNGLTITPR